MLVNMDQHHNCFAMAMIIKHHNLAHNPTFWILMISHIQQGRLTCAWILKTPQIHHSSGWFCYRNVVMQCKEGLLLWLHQIFVLLILALKAEMKYKKIKNKNKKTIKKQNWYSIFIWYFENETIFWHFIFLKSKVYTIVIKLFKVELVK